MKRPSKLSLDFNAYAWQPLVDYFITFEKLNLSRPSTYDDVVNKYDECNYD